MRLNDIRDNAGARQARKRLGRGIGSGLGKTGGRGGKGQTARTGVRINGFEGGQMPLYRRLPKRGFNVPNPRHYNEINVGDVQAAIDAGRLDAKQTVTLAALKAAGIVKKALDGLRLLGEGELKTAVSFEVVHATKAATAAVEKAGGSITINKPQPSEADLAKSAKSQAKKAKSGKGGKKAPAGKASE